MRLIGIIEIDYPTLWRKLEIVVQMTSGIGIFIEYPTNLARICVTLWLIKSCGSYLNHYRSTYRFSCHLWKGYTDIMIELITPGGIRCNCPDLTKKKNE